MFLPRQAPSTRPMQEGCCVASQYDLGINMILTRYIHFIAVPLFRAPPPGTVPKVLYDLGCGDGRICIEAAESRGAKACGERAFQQ